MRGQKGCQFDFLLARERPTLDKVSDNRRISSSFHNSGGHFRQDQSRGNQQQVEVHDAANKQLESRDIHSYSSYHRHERKTLEESYSRAIKFR